MTMTEMKKESYLANSCEYILEFPCCIPELHVKYLVVCFLKRMLTKNHDRRPNMAMVSEFFMALARYIHNLTNQVVMRSEIARMILLNACFDLPGSSLKEWEIFLKNTAVLREHNGSNYHVISRFIYHRCFRPELIADLHALFLLHKPS